MDSPNPQWQADGLPVLRRLWKPFVPPGAGFKLPERETRQTGRPFAIFTSSARLAKKQTSLGLNPTTLFAV